MSEKYLDYCKDEVYQQLKSKGFAVEIDETNDSLNKKIRNAQLSQFNYIVVAGEEEVIAGEIDVRARDGTRHGKKTVCEFAKGMVEEYPEGVPRPSEH